MSRFILYGLLFTGEWMRYTLVRHGHPDPVIVGPTHPQQLGATWNRAFPDCSGRITAMILGFAANLIAAAILPVIPTLVRAASLGGLQEICGRAVGGLSFTSVPIDHACSPRPDWFLFAVDSARHLLGLLAAAAVLLAWKKWAWTGQARAQS